MSRADLFGVGKAERKRRLERCFDWEVRKLGDMYGSCAHLIPDTLLLADDILEKPSTGWQAYCTAAEVSHTVTGLLDDPLMAALLNVNDAAAARCQHCQSDQPLRVASINPSGSSAEGLADGIVGAGGTSDFDLMFEFDAPFQWAALGKIEEPAVITPQSAPQMWARPTKNPGFVTLHWVKTTKCSHDKPLEALPADSIRQLMVALCRAMKSGKISTAGPAVNIKRSNDVTAGGIDYVPCILVRGWWPADQLDGCHLEVDFPPAAARADIRRFGVHLVPTGRPGSDTEFIEFRISYSRAEVITVRYLASVIRAAIVAVKAMKNTLKKSEVISEDLPLKSYFIKTAGLWLAQTTPASMWKGVTDGVNKILDWLEDKLNAGKIPCFFDHNIDVAAELSTVERRAIIDAVRLMREYVACLLMASCVDQWDVDLLLEGGLKPLTERQLESELRLRLGRTLVRQAVVEGVRFRHTAPCWESWWKQTIPQLVYTAPLLLQWYYYTRSGAYLQQCLMLMAWVVVDSADLVGGAPMSSSVSDMVTLDATPLIQLLTRSDLEYLLGDPDKVETWCSQQLRRPLEERPAGLTAGLDTPRGRAELLLRPELLLQAVRVNVPGKMNWWRDIDRATKNMWMKNYGSMRSYQETREKLEQHINTNLHVWLRVKLPEMDAASVDATAGLWRRRLQQLLSGDRLRTMYNAVTGWWPDRWEMTSHYLAVHEADSEDSEQDNDDGQAGGEERRSADEDQTSGGLPSPQREKWQQLERQHQQLWQQLERRGHGERRSLNKQHDEERRRLERIHDRKWRSMEMRHHDERKRLHQRHESVNRCVELQYQGQAQQERRQRQLELLSRRNRRQLAVLERQHQIEWGDLEQKVQTQWNKLKQKHLRESQELEERYPNMQSGEELDQLMEKCSRRRRQLRKELEKELQKEKEKETEKKLEKKKEKEKKKEIRKVQEKNLKVEKEEDKSVERDQQKRQQQQRRQQQQEQQQQRRRRRRRQQQQHEPQPRQQDRQPSRRCQHLRNLVEVTRRHRQQLIQLKERHNQELEEQRRRHRQEWQDLERRLSRRRHGQERRHPQ
ncbi:uncharacterized protein LOC122390629 [Amphibalanus amphitrite]|uniref:uncharacterized protein LOC122390629 n=1 Tax=Amphibalanus amphitrite TaxID=1232801 RepID=UPI001C90FC16|nr:uncharacterized protein LOC122390629 [Amphibalanus amphitrite]